ncbi:MAG: cytochrome c maturation protein CcmE [Chloroflexota bacterium]
MQSSLPPSASAPSQTALDPASNGRHIKLIVAGGAIVLAVTYLIVTALQTSTVYYITVGELHQRGPAAMSQQVRVAGDVVPGSVEKIDAGLAIRFLVHDGSGQMPVYYKGGPVPDIFGEEVQVVVEGKVDPSGTFQASTLLAKCPSKFETEGATGV